MSKLTPLKPVPSLKVETLSGAGFDLSASKPEHFTLVIFYRGLHCPICKTYVRDLESKLDDFAKIGVNAVAISSDSQERAERQVKDWGLSKIDIGYGLSIESAREWGLYVSKSVKDSEPAIFSEPGLFLVKPDGTLYASSVQTMPFTRPNLRELLGGLDYIIQNDYPGRGEA